MNKSILFIFFLSIFLLHGKNVSAQDTMILELEEAGTEIYDLTTLHKVTFSEDIFTLNFYGGNSKMFDIQSISKVLFSVPSNIQNLTYKKRKVMIFPNPAGEYIYVKYEEEQSVSLTIVSLEGKVIVSTENVSVGEPIYIGHLSSGFYLVKINHHTVKLHKI